MKKIFTIITDTHEGSFNPCLVSDEEYKKPNVIVLGDIDLKRCLKKDVKKVQSKIDWIKSLGVPYVCSNHEGEQGLPLFYFDEETKTIFSHGCHLKKNAEKYLKDCHTTWEGSSYLMHILTGMASKFIHLVPFTKDDAKRASDFAKIYGAKNIVLGHWHVSYDENVNGVRVVVLPRGLTTIELGE